MVLNNGLVLKEQVVFVYDCCTALHGICSLIIFVFIVLYTNYMQDS